MIFQTRSALAYQLTVDIKPHKYVIMLGEPVLIAATVVNHGAETVGLIHHNAPTVAQGKLSVVDILLGADATRLKRWSDDLRPVYKTKPKLVGAGESITIDLMILFNREAGFSANESGKYWLSGRIVISPSPYTEVLSEPVAIEIREPSTTADRSSWQWLNVNKDEYGRMLQIPWAAQLTDEFLREAGRRCETSQSVYSEYLSLFLSRAYREGPKKNPELSSRFAQIAMERASTDKLRSEAEKILRSPGVEARPAPVGAVARAVDDATERAVAEVLEKFAAAVTGGRLDECAALLSEDFLRNGILDKARMIEELEEDLSKQLDVEVSIKVDAVSATPQDNEFDVSARLLAKIPSRGLEHS